MESVRTMTLGTAEKTRVSTLAEATSNISQTVSSDCVKIHEAMEFCSKAEIKSKELKAETKQLTIDKNESLQVRDELISRNKANAANWENWVQTRYELDKLKCDLKAEVMMIDIATQAKRAKFIKTVKSFRKQWDETENQYKNFPEVQEYDNLRKLNESLSDEIEKRKNLLEYTIGEYSELLKAHKESLQGKFIEFAKETISLIRLSHFDQEKKEKEKIVNNLQEELQRLLKLQNQKKEDSAMHFKPSISHFDIRSAFNQAASNTKNYSAVDITAFDKISIPIENLETSTDEDLFSFSKYKNITSEIDSSVQSDALSDNNSDGGDSQVLSPTENNQGGAQNQYSSHFQTQGQNQITNEAATANQSHYWTQKESEDKEKNKPKNKENSEIKTVRFATKRASQEVMEEPQAKVQDLGEKDFGQVEEQNESNGDQSYENNDLNDPSFEFEDTYDNFSNKSYGSFEGDAPVRSPGSSENTFLNTENRAQVPSIPPPSPPPTIRPTLDSNPLQNILPISRAESPAPAQPFSFTFNSSTPAKSSIFNLF